MEFAILEIKGQSFMLHQIRKMVAVVIAVARNIIPEETINEAFKTMDKLEIPIAPGLGLCLCHVRNFDSTILCLKYIFYIICNYCNIKQNYKSIFNNNLFVIIDIELSKINYSTHTHARARVSVCVYVCCMYIYEYIRYIDRYTMIIMVRGMVQMVFMKH